MRVHGVVERLRNHFGRNHSAWTLPCLGDHFAYSSEVDCASIIPLSFVRAPSNSHNQYDLCLFLEYCSCFLSFSERMKFLLPLRMTVYHSGSRCTLGYSSTSDSFQSLETTVQEGFASFNLSFSSFSFHGGVEPQTIQHQSWHRTLDSFSFDLVSLAILLLQKLALYFGPSYLGWTYSCH